LKLNGDFKPFGFLKPSFGSLMTQLLIVTSQSDIHVDALINYLDNTLDNRKIEPIRLNTENFIQQAHYQFTWDKSGNACDQKLAFQDSSRIIKDVKVIWWRKPQDYYPYKMIEDEWAIKYSQEESKSLVQSLPGLFPKAKWINNYYDLRFPSRRINQIPLAKQLDIPIPPTLVTNQYEPIVTFLKQYGSCIIKPMDYSGFLHDDKQYACYTRPIDLETIDALRDSIHLAPVFIQQRISKKAEYRVTLIGKKSFVCRIETEHLNDAEVNQDWRVTEPDKLVHTPDTLPEDYIAKLHKMLELLGLNFGAFDIIRGDDDVLYFIELNPNGQWYWIEILTGMPMVKAMVELIEDLAQH
jgi:hypothetical protein